MCTPFIVDGSAGDSPKSRLPAASLPGPIDPRPLPVVLLAHGLTPLSPSVSGVTTQGCL